jgi:hypothetical protein
MSMTIVRLPKTQVTRTAVNFITDLSYDFKYELHVLTNYHPDMSAPRAVTQVILTLAAERWIQMSCRLLGHRDELKDGIVPFIRCRDCGRIHISSTIGE